MAATLVMQLYEKNFKLTGTNEDPSLIDYDILGLHKRRIIICGELVVTEYYNNYNYLTDVYSDLVVSESRQYFRDGMAMVGMRQQTTNWYFDNNDGSWDGTCGVVGQVDMGTIKSFQLGVDFNGPSGSNGTYGIFPDHYDFAVGTGEIGLTKLAYKFYTPIESRNEGVTRRQNAVDEATMYVLYQVGLEGGLAIQDALTPVIISFVNGNPFPIREAIESSDMLTFEQKGEILRILTMANN